MAVPSAVDSSGQYEDPTSNARRAAGSHIVAVTESARQSENLVIVERVTLLSETLNVNDVTLGAGLFKGEGGLEVAVGSGSTDD